MIRRWRQCWENIQELHPFCPKYCHPSTRAHIPDPYIERGKDSLWDFWFPLWQIKNVEITLPSHCCWNKFHKPVIYNNINLSYATSGGQKSKISLIEQKASGMISIWSRNIYPRKKDCESTQNFTFILEIIASYFFPQAKVTSFGWISVLLNNNW